jgi:hypothetical protein
MEPILKEIIISFIFFRGIIISLGKKIIFQKRIIISKKKKPSRTKILILPLWFNFVKKTTWGFKSD